MSYPREWAMLEWQRIKITGVTLDRASCDRLRRMNELRVRLDSREHGKRYLDKGAMLLCTSLRRDRLPL